MKLEAGKSYMDRLGNKVHLISILSPESRTLLPAVGWVFAPTKLPYILQYTKVGSVTGSTSEAPGDIVSEWKEPKFEITEPGLYRTVKHALVEIVTILEIPVEHPCKGYIENGNSVCSWKKDGSFLSSGKSKNDIVSKGELNARP